MSQHRGADVVPAGSAGRGGEGARCGAERLWIVSGMVAL